MTPSDNSRRKSAVASTPLPAIPSLTGSSASAGTTLPDLTDQGFLPPGIHRTTLAELRKAFGGTTTRYRLCEQLDRFVAWVTPMNQFASLYIGGGFVSHRAEPSDLDVILETRERYGPLALEAMVPFFQRGLGEILKEYSIHLHFWCPGFPGGIQDFRLFFQYFRPHEAAERGIELGTRKGIVRIML